VVATQQRQEVPVSKKRKRKKNELTPEELKRQRAERLPDREVMSLISPPTIAPDPEFPIDQIPDKAV
jgi:hypothetical protein